MNQYKPGVYTNLSFEEYWQIDAVNHSTLRAFRQTAAHARENILNPERIGRSGDLGSMVHCAVLTPGIFERLYICKEDWVQSEHGATAQRAFNAVRKTRLDKGEVTDLGMKIDKKTTEGRVFWRSFSDSVEGKIVVETASDMSIVRGIMRAIKNSPTASALLAAGGYSEITVVWRDEESGELCKMRGDRLTTLYGESIIVDLKTAIDASENGFAAAVAKFGYDSQAAMYLDGAKAIGQKVKMMERNWRHVHLVVETKAPYGVACYELNDAALGTGRLKWRNWLKTYSECKKSGEYPCYPDGITPLGLPKWAVDESLRNLEE